MNARPVTLSLIIPALNESEIIVAHVQELKNWTLSKLPSITYEIVVVNDGSTDGMGPLLEKTCKEIPELRVLHHKVNMGRGRAVRTAMEHTSSDFIIVLDADLSYGPEHIKPMLNPLLNDEADLTLASPYHDDGIVENVPAFRAWLSKWGNRVLSKSFQSNVKTSTCVVRGYTRNLIDHLELIQNGKDFHLESLYKTEVQGFRVKEIPARLIWRDKNRGKRTKEQGNFITNNPLFRMRSAIFSHLVFNFFSKPKLLFIGPIFLFLIIGLFGTFNLASSYINNIILGLEQPLRQTFLDGELTLRVTLTSFLLLSAITFFLFLSSQAKKYYEENYILLSRMNHRMKQIEKKLSDGE